MNLIITHWLHKGLELASGNECFAIERFQLFGIKTKLITLVSRSSFFACIQIRNDVIYLTGIGFERKMLNFKRIVWRNFMPLPFQTVYGCIAVFKEHVDAAAIIFIVYMDTVLFSIKEAEIWNGDTGITIRLYVFLWNYRLPNLLEGLLQAIVQKICLPCCNIFWRHFHRMCSRFFYYIDIHGMQCYHECRIRA